MPVMSEIQGSPEQYHYHEVEVKNISQTKQTPRKPNLRVSFEGKPFYIYSETNDKTANILLICYWLY